MPRNNPLVSIIVPTYNRASIIGKTLDSILKQEYMNWECLVIDDGSTDETEAILKDYITKDSRFRFFNRSNDRKKGANACRNYGLELSKGEYVNWFDSDDIMHTSYLGSQIDFLDNSNYNFSICKCKWLTKEGKILDGFRSNRLKSDDPINDYIQFIIFWPINSVCYKKEFLLRNALKFDETLQQSQEYDFHVKILQVDKHFGILDKQLITIIASEDSVSYSNNNSYAKTVSSLKVRKRFLKDTHRNNLKLQTKLFLLTDIHRMFQQQTMLRHTKASLYAACFYLSAHWRDEVIFKRFFFRHLFPVVIISLVYNLFGIGYRLFKKSNTFNYVKNL